MTDPELEILNYEARTLFCMGAVLVSVCLAVCLSVCPSVCLSVCRSVCLSVCLSVRRSACLYVCMHVCMHVCITCMCVYIYMHMLKSICICIYVHTTLRSLPQISSEEVSELVLGDPGLLATQPQEEPRDFSWVYSHMRLSMYKCNV